MFILDYIQRNREASLAKLIKEKEDVIKNNSLHKNKDLNFKVFKLSMKIKDLKRKLYPDLCLSCVKMKKKLDIKCNLCNKSNCCKNCYKVCTICTRKNKYVYHCKICSYQCRLCKDYCCEERLRVSRFLIHKFGRYNCYDCGEGW